MRNDDDEINPFSPEYTARHGSAAGPTPEPPTPRKRGGGSFLVWLIPLLLAMVIFPVICCGGLLFFGVSRVVEEMNAPLDAAVMAIEADDRIAAKLGTPIERTSLSGDNNFKTRNGDGNANVSFNIKGPDGSARVQGKMKSFAGVWSPEDLTITCSDGTEFKIPATVEVEPNKSF